jgi:hypothetical protein
MPPCLKHKSYPFQAPSTTSPRQTPRTTHARDHKPRHVGWVGEPNDGPTCRLAWSRFSRLNPWLRLYVRLYRATPGATPIAPSGGGQRGRVMRRREMASSLTNLDNKVNCHLRLVVYLPSPQAPSGGHAKSISCYHRPCCEVCSELELVSRRSYHDQDQKGPWDAEPRRPRSVCASRR